MKKTSFRRAMTAATSLVILATAAFVSGCSNIKADIAKETVPADAGAIVETSTTDAPWYSERLEKMGFFVFPSPEPLPPFSVRTLSGADVGVGSLGGKVVLLNFWATWCPPCKSEMPSIQALHERMKGSAFEVMAISVAERPSTVRDFLSTNPYTFPIYLDESGDASAPFAGRGIPTTFLLDKQGRAIAAVIGARSYDDPETLALFRELAERL
ncbi:MAG: TlpA family protein disulfide reductase [Spirochaetae bacterium HGW-Spirochaetae-3]|jgi:thiol-disulfide isomerase/thioredoxin|nr:MAG: TlpA family protein disulfide reductase [Spirochaetae bacterium HGW-Spirochaetae-3]